MTTLAVILLMIGSLLIWAGITNNSIIDLMSGVLGGKSKK